MVVGTGCDLTPVARLQAACERRPSLLGRLFTPAELAGAEAAGAHRWERLAGIFAAKESALKALGTGMRVPFADLEVGHDSAGRPLLHLRGAAEQVARALDIARLHISISHAGGMALATAVAEADRPAPPPTLEQRGPAR